MILESIVFYSLAVASVGSALLMVTRRNPVIAALYLILNFFCLAGLYLTLQAQFIAVIHILVYAGAIMVLFLFVIMLLNLGDERKLSDAISPRKIIAGGLSLALLLELLSIFVTGTEGLPEYNADQALQVGTVEYIGKQLFTKFLFPFEVTSILLLAAIIGAILLAKKKPD